MKKIFYTVVGAILLVSIGMAQVPLQPLTPQEVPAEPPTDIEVPAEPPTEPAPDAAEEMGEDDVEHLLRGPVHEAFAEPIQLSAEDPLIVPKAPPEPIEEVAPNIEIEEGRNSVWIPGYWAWDDERKDYIWVSGVWRNSPMGRRWVPGTWEESDGGYRWIPGRWAAAAGGEPEQLLPPPPVSLEEGPSTQPPSDDRFWVPALGDTRTRTMFGGPVFGRDAMPVGFGFRTIM